MATATMPPAKIEPKPVLLRALTKRWKGHYMIGPDEICGDLFWWDGKGRQPKGTQRVDPATVPADTLPKPPDLKPNMAPGGGPRLRRDFTDTLSQPH